VESLSRWFEQFFFAPEDSARGSGGQVCTVIGSGGKTSLIWLLAESQRRRKVLVSPATKMYPPPPELHRCDRCFFGGEYPFPADGGEYPGGGICLAGILNKETGKLEALSPEILSRIVPRYDLALLEGDGARGLPLKGWADHEPLVPPATTVTIGVIPATPLGEKASEDIIFRLPQFVRLSGAREGQTITPLHLAAVITGNAGGRGLFSAARGKKLLFINQVEGPARQEQARETASLLPAEFRSGLAAIIAGSVKQNQAEVLYFHGNSKF
jgi:probable selenium-dependent hydroxylase accessory protein YqeC